MTYKCYITTAMTSVQATTVYATPRDKTNVPIHSYNNTR